jgi:hypothetical protein
MELNYTLNTSFGGLGKVEFNAYRIAEENIIQQQPMPEGIRVTIKPSTFIATSHKNYHCKTIISTDSDAFLWRICISHQCTS